MRVEADLRRAFTAHPRRAERPSLVTEGALAWMESEAFAIMRRVDASAAFDDAADRATHGDTPDAFDLPTGGFSDGALGRFEMLARASLLDWVIDSLADWVEATPSPSIIAAREAKHAAHEKAVAAYRYRYRSGPP